MLKDNNTVNNTINKVAYDRTNWYAVVDSVYSICQNQQMEMMKMTNLYHI